MAVPPEHSGPDRPTTDGDSEAWWTAIQDHRLTVSSCRSCARKSLYMRPFCPHCWSEEVEPMPASGRAQLYTWSVVHQNAAPFDARTPYVLAMVDLEEGPRLMTVLQNCPVENLQPEMDLILAFREDEDGFIVPVFEPTVN